MTDIMNTRVLVLNSSYEPLTVCKLDKAIILMFLEKVDVVENYPDLKLHSSNETYEVPSIIRLKRYVRIHNKKIELSKKNIIRRDGHKCQYCGSKTNLTVDHVHPKSRGGKDTWTNLITACVRCNNKKSNRTPKEANMKLMSEPHKPGYHTFLKTTIGKAEESWNQFMFI